MAERFWENLSIILAERNISWIELTRKMFEAFVVPSYSDESFDTNDSIHLDSETLPQTFFWLTQSS